MYDFDEVIDRRGTGSSKWDGFEERFPGLDVRGALPMWVADMDFRCPDEVVQAVKEKAAQGIYGYPAPRGEAFNNAAAGWLLRRDGWNIDKAWIVETAGVVPAVTYAVQEFTEEGDGVIIQTPVYYPFKDRCITYNKRRAVENPLIEENGYYSMDFEDLQQKAADPGTKLMILCSPHNPVGRVWTRQELAEVSRICRENNVLLFSDEIHSDLIMPGYTHTTAAQAGGEGNLIAAYAPSRTFNLAGMRTSAIIIPDEKIRSRFQARIRRDEAGGRNFFGETALVAAWTYGDSYLQQLAGYIGRNLEYVRSFAAEKLRGVHIAPTEGTYFAWVDFRGTGLSEKEINKKVCEEAKIAGDLGGWFGRQGAGFIRLNLACPRSTAEEAMRRLEKVFPIK